MKKKKILFVAQNLRMGGAQTSLINLLNELLMKDEYQIDLFAFAPGELSSQVPKKVNLQYGNKKLRLIATPFSAVIQSKNLINILLRLYMMFRVRIVGSKKLYTEVFKKCKINDKYDAAISYFNDVPNNYFNQGTNLYVAEFTDAEEKVAWIHTDPVASGFDKEYCKEIYKAFHKIVCVSKAVKEKMDYMLPEYSDKTMVVYNKFNKEALQSLADEYKVDVDKSKFNIVTVARIDNASKRINEIVKMCFKLKQEGICNFCWRIVGDGPDIVSNKKTAKQLRVEDLVIFEEERINPYPFIKSADLFALYSAYEGYPMVIGEALILNVPVLSKEYAAAKEQIPQEKGYIAKSDEEFYEKLKEYIKLK